MLLTCHAIDYHLFAISCFVFAILLVFYDVATDFIFSIDLRYVFNTNFQILTCIIFFILFGLCSFSHSSTLPIPKETYPRK